MAISIAASEAGTPTLVPRFAFAALLAGNVALTFGPMLVRLADSGPVSAGFWRLFLALPMLFLFVRWQGQRFSGVAPALWTMIGLGGVLFAADLASWHLGIVQTKIANATLFGNITSLLLPLWGIAVLRQKPSRLQVSALLLAALGTALLMGNSYELSPRYLRGDLLCILAGIFYTGYVLSIQRARQTLGSWALLAVSTAAGTAPMLFFAILLDEPLLPTHWTPVLILAMSSQVVGQGLIVYSLAYFTPLVVGLTLLLQPLIGALIGWLVFSETLTMTDALGAVAIAIALVLVRLPSRA